MVKMTQNGKLYLDWKKLLVGNPQLWASLSVSVGTFAEDPSSYVCGVLTRAQLLGHMGLR